MSRSRHGSPIRKLGWVLSILLLTISQGINSTLVYPAGAGPNPMQQPPVKRDLAAAGSKLQSTNAGKETTGLAGTSRAAEYEISWLVKLVAWNQLIKESNETFKVMLWNDFIKQDLK